MPTTPPSRAPVLALAAGADGTVRGKAAIRALYAQALERFPALRFELEEVIERPWGVLVLYRKHGVFAERPGLTIEAFEGHGAASRSA